MSAAPLIVDDTVVVLPGGSNGRSIVAYDRRTGKRSWSAQNDRAAYASPMLVTLGGTRQILVFTATRLMGVSPDRGAVLWEFPWTTAYDVNAAQPVVVSDNRVFLSSGYGTGAAVIEIERRTGAADGAAFSVREVWRNVRMKNRFASSVCTTGSSTVSTNRSWPAWTPRPASSSGKAAGTATASSSSRAATSSCSVKKAISRSFVPCPPSHEELARFPAISGKTWNVPTIADGVLLVRNLQEMAAFDLRRTLTSSK